MANDQTPSVPEIYTVTSRRFIWRRNSGFSYQPGSEEHIGLNRTREGALDRIVAMNVSSDERQRAFLATLFDEYEMATIGHANVGYEDGDHVVQGQRFHIKIAYIGD